MKLLHGKKMFQIIKNEPQYFASAKSKVKLPKVKGAWEDSHICEIRSQLRADMLLGEQNLLCSYCEKEIDEHPMNSNIDHFKTRDLFPELTLVYENFLVSCNTSSRCSSFKDTHIKRKDEYTKIINPVVENPNKFLEYFSNGRVVAKNEKGQFTIDIFNLNDISLVESRLQVANSLKHLALSLGEILDIFPDYHSFIKNIYPKIKSL